ncbi:zinc finger BED domain-containing protein 5-like [Oratosquilla oratoria]|uniref:zinc finger BED domain-containing protein 5-like n=1 Tax=Oratosquilla oratoria TaxID=337810 RepID=UPI003F75AF00
MAAANAKKKCRKYSPEYLKFGFVPSFTNETMPMCILCEKTFSNDAMKPSKMKDHLERIHSDKKNKDLDFFEMVKEKISNRPNLKNFFKAPPSADNEGLKTSYSISLNIAKKGKAYTIGEEIIIPAIKDVIENVMKENSQPVLKCIPLSANAVQRRIDEMADDVEKTLTTELQHCMFSIHLNESTYTSSNILMAYVRYNSPSLNCIVDEFLFGKYLEGDVKVATDGAPAIFDRHMELTASLKERVSSVRTVHCVLDKHHLVAKELSGELHDALTVCIRSVNKIKAHPLNSQLFAMPCGKDYKDLNQFLLQNDETWLSRDDSLQRLVDLYDSTVEFLIYVDPSLCAELNRCKNHLFYLADLYSKFNEVQKRLQGNDVTMIQTRTILIGFQVKIGLFISSLARKDFKYFSNLRQLEEQNISDCDLEIYIRHLNNLRKDFNMRFEDLEKMHIPDWIVTPFDVEIENADLESHLEDELVDMCVDLEAKYLFRSKKLIDYWNNANTTTKYPKLSATAEPFLLAFPSSYMVEAGFSHAIAVLTKQNILNQEEFGDLRLKLTNLQPNINTLADAHQTLPNNINKFSEKSIALYNLAWVESRTEFPKIQKGSSSGK